MNLFYYKRDLEIIVCDEKIKYDQSNIIIGNIMKLWRKIFGHNRRPSVLIDLYSLRDLACGFGQIALNYARRYSEIQKQKTEDYDISFLLPWWGKYPNSWSGVKCYRESPFLMKQLKPEIWHSPNQFCRVYPKDPKTKLIFTIHDYNFLFEETPERKEKILNVMQHRIDRASVVTFISQFAYDVVKKHSNLEGKETRVIYDGVEFLADKSSTKPKFVRDATPFFFAMGQFLPKKKFDLLLDVMKQFPDRILYLCGQNNLCDYARETMERIQKEHITNVIAPGVISNENRVWLYANCEAYLFPSIGEGFGLPAIEAMQFGKPVFVSSYQSLPEIVNDHGYIWPSLEPQEMADYMKVKLEEYRKDKTFGDRARKYAKTFSYESHIQQYLRLYRELLSKCK